MINERNTTLQEIILDEPWGSLLCFRARRELNRRRVSYDTDRESWAETQRILAEEGRHYDDLGEHEVDDADEDYGETE